MRFDVLTLFPGMFPSYLGQSLLKLAIERGLIEVELHNIRDWAHDKHHTVDDRPFGGGPGMVLKVEPVVECVEAVQAMPIDRVVDVTGAGDLFAAGFLVGLARGKDHRTAARLGALAAAEVIQHIGARPAVSLKALAAENGLPV